MDEATKTRREQMIMSERLIEAILSMVSTSDSEEAACSMSDWNWRLQPAMRNVNTGQNDPSQEL